LLRSTCLHELAADQRSAAAGLSRVQCSNPGARRSSPVDHHEGAVMLWVEQAVVPERYMSVQLQVVQEGLCHHSEHSRQEMSKAEWCSLLTSLLLWLATTELLCTLQDRNGCTCRHMPYLPLQLLMQALIAHAQHTTAAVQPILLLHNPSHLNRAAF